ncbi:MAG: class SAM-dependent methyltransferase [Marmoricola sp.]|nr:class SAM-dependent methyltransferase [Marmoricola sp.]
MPASPGHSVRKSPNIWDNPATYEIENQAFDRAGLIVAAMRRTADWTDRAVLDIGCGTGFHLPLFAQDAATVTGLEPHAPLAAIARRRVRRLPQVWVIEAPASDVPLSGSTVDVAHARWAYFFGPGCEPGLAQLDRVMRSGGTAFVIDNDPTTSTFGSWFHRGFPEVDPDAVEAFWTAQGWEREQITTTWTFDSRDDFEAVVRIELPTTVAEEVLAEHPDATEVDYAVNLWWRRY